MFCRMANKFNATIQKAKSHAKTAAHKVKCFCMKSIHAIRPDHHRRPHIPTLSGQPVHLPTHNRVRPGQFGSHRHAHSQHHGWVHAFVRGSKRVFSFVILPILVGIVFGIAASAIGMLVGQVVVALWLRYRARSSSAVLYQRLEADEKEGLPKYEDLEDTQSVVEEKI